jgi:hypothetical protein
MNQALYAHMNNKRKMKKNKFRASGMKKKLHSSSFQLGKNLILFFLTLGVCHHNYH